MEKELHKIDEILGDFLFSTDPSLFIDELKDFGVNAKPDLALVKKYQEDLQRIRAAWQRICRYPTYLRDFYPVSEDIEKHEALQYHIHSCLQDMTLLRNKIVSFLGRLGKDVKKKATNKEEVKDFYKLGVETVYAAFARVSVYREVHHHDGRIFEDGDLVSASVAHLSVKTLSNPVFDQYTSPELRAKAFAHWNAQKEEKFKTAQERWIKNTEGFEVTTTGLLNSILSTIQDNLYIVVNVVPIVQILQRKKGEAAKGK